MVHGIKELKDVIEAVDATAVAIQKAKADGSIDWMDLPKLGGPALAWKDAIVGFEQIPAEIKDLDAEELKEVLASSLMAIKHLGEVLLSTGE